MATKAIGDWIALLRQSSGEGDRLAPGFAHDFAFAIAAEYERLVR